MDLLERPVISPLAILIMRDRLLSIKSRFEWILREAEWGPGRVDTFNPPKAPYFNYPEDSITDEDQNAAVNLPSVWNQRKKSGMHLDWDGNNADVIERNKNAAFSTESTTPT